MANKRDELIHNENTGMGLLRALGAVAIGIVGAAIAANNSAIGAQENRNKRKEEIQAEIEELKIQRNHYENEFMGKFVYSDEIDAINSKISRLANELRAL